MACNGEKNSTNRSLLLTGASGLLGRALYAYFSSKEWDVTGVAFSRAGGENNLVKVDLNDGVAVKELVNRVKPSLIIHSAAMRFPDQIESNYDAAVNLNVNSTRELAEQAKLLNIPMLYISTDYVFDGKDSPYSENSKPNPINKYGCTKLQGEEATLKTSPQNMVLRIPTLYGPVQSLTESAITCLLPILKDKEKPCQVSDYEVRFPTHVFDIALVCFSLCGKKLEDGAAVSGIYQFAAKEGMTKYESLLVYPE